MCADGKHDYFKFNEVMVVCRKCGDAKSPVIADWTYRPPVWYPAYPWYPQPLRPYWYTWTDNTGGTVTIDSIDILNGGTTYSAES